MGTIARQAITVDPDLHGIWGDLDGESFEGLKTEIHADGIRDSLVLWKHGTENILIDGHNRLRIAELLHLNEIPVCWKEFSDKAEAAGWIVSHQSARRNMTDWQKYKAVEVYQRILREKAKSHLGGDHGNQYSPSLEKSPKLAKEEQINVRKQTAEAANLSEWRVRQGDFIQKNATEEQKAALDSGKKSLPEVYKEVLKANAPTKADRIAEAEKMVEATKQEDGKVTDLQVRQAHKQAEQRLLEAKASSAYDIIYNIIRESRKLTDEMIETYREVYFKKNEQQFLINARSIWDAGQKLIELGKWTQEVTQ